MRIHVAGVGKMGLPMARHLRAAGHDVSFDDPDPSRVPLAREAGLREGTMADAQVVLSSLPHDAALLQVADRVAAQAPRGALWIDTSTVSPTASARAAAVVNAAGIDCLRCTVSGNNHMAEAARLTVMASGPRDAWALAEPLLSAFGPSRFYLGEGEQSRLMKLVVNLMIAQTSAMLSEALALGRKGGLDWEAMWEVLCASAVASPIVQAKRQQLARRDFTPTFTVHQMVKDLDLILGAAADAHVPLAQTAMTRQLMDAAIAQGFGEDDYASIIRAVERSAGLSDIIEP